MSLSTISVENCEECEGNVRFGQEDSFHPERTDPEENGEPPNPEIGKAATLVMLQPSAPAREPTAWIHAPSQPLMRSPLSRSQTPAPPRESQPVFSGLVALQVALPSRSLSLLRTDKFDFANPFSRRRETN